MSQTSTDIPEIVSRIRRYCADHPQAADTLEGVRSWWLGASLADTPAGDVERALLLLVEQGCIERRSLRDGTHLYFAGLEGGRS